MYFVNAFSFALYKSYFGTVNILDTVSEMGTNLPDCFKPEFNIIVCLLFWICVIQEILEHSH